jgi:hypothetical protein
LRRQSGTTSCQQGRGEGTDRTPGDKAHHHLLGRRRMLADQEAITRQGCRLMIRCGTLPRLHPQRCSPLAPAVWLGLGHSTPPDFVRPAKDPGAMGLGQADQPIPLVLFRT